MAETLMRVTCPNCRTNFRVDPAAIPPEGANATCKKCGQPFLVRKPAAAAASESTQAQPVVEIPRQDTVYGCPRCGHRQSQPHRCYACGAAMASKTNAAPAALSPGVPFAAGTDAPAAPGMGEIAVRTRHDPANWLCRAAKPRICIDGMEYNREWGLHAFVVPAGGCTFSVDSRFFFWHAGRKTMDVCVSSTEKTFIDYGIESKFGFDRVTIRRVTLAEGLGWQVRASLARPAAKRTSSQIGVILGLVLLGPIGLVPLWKSDQFSTNAKISITAAMVFIILLLLAKL